jgi:hypothetical protein
MNTETKETTNSFWGFLGRVIVAQLCQSRSISYSTSTAY